MENTEHEVTIEYDPAEWMGVDEKKGSCALRLHTTWTNGFGEQIEEIRAYEEALRGGHEEI